MWTVVECVLKSQTLGLFVHLFEEKQNVVVVSELGMLHDKRGLFNLRPCEVILVA